MGSANENMAEEVSKSVLVSQKKKCFICEANEAEYYIKGEPESGYCKECAQDSFGDLDCLVKF